MTLGLLCWPVIIQFPYILKCLILIQALSMIYMATAQVLPEAVYLVNISLFGWLAIFLHTKPYVRAIFASETVRQKMVPHTAVREMKYFFGGGGVERRLLILIKKICMVEPQD